MIADVLFRILNITIKVGFWASTIVVFVILLTLILSGVVISLNNSIVIDLFYITQLWLPFNLNVIFVWISTLVVAYFAYRVALWAFVFIGELLRNN